nr:uncharacterized protein C12orf76 homolog [Loxodonta africana]
MDSLDFGRAARQWIQGQQQLGDHDQRREYRGSSEPAGGSQVPLAVSCSPVLGMETERSSEGNDDPDATLAGAEFRLRVTVTLATRRVRRAEGGTEGGVWEEGGAGLVAEVVSPPLQPGEDAASGVLVAVAGGVRPPGGAGGGPEPRGAARAEPAVCSAARTELGVDGNHFQHPAGNHDPYGILCLQAYSASVTASKQVVLRFGNRIHCVAHGPVEKLELELSCLEMTFGLDSW